jgi:hypothetical protein
VIAINEIMAYVPVLAYQQFWMDKRASLKSEYNSLVGTHLNAAASIWKLVNVLCSNEDLASCTPVSVGESVECASKVSSADDNFDSYFKALCGRALFSALYGTNTLTLNELIHVLKVISQAGQTKQEDVFKEV